MSYNAKMFIGVSIEKPKMDLLFSKIPKAFAFLIYDQEYLQIIKDESDNYFLGNFFNDKIHSIENVKNVKNCILSLLRKLNSLYDFRIPETIHVVAVYNYELLSKLDDCLL